MFKPCLYSPTVAFNLYKSPVEPRFYRRRNKGSVESSRPFICYYENTLSCLLRGSGLR